MKFDKPYFGVNETEPNPDSYLCLWMHHDGESHWANKQQILNRITQIHKIPRVHPSYSYLLEEQYAILAQRALEERNLSEQVKKQPATTTAEIAKSRWTGEA
jgi:hypothetical protein